MDQKPDMIKEDIEETRAHLADKLNDLEDELRGQVETAKDKIRQLNPRHQISSHPLAAVGGSIAVGLAAGYLISGRGRRADGRWATEDVESAGELSAELPQTSEYERPARHFARREHRPNVLWHTISTNFGDEIQLVKGMALGALFNTARDAAKQVAPKLSEQIDRVADSVTQKFGVKEHGPART